MIRRLDEYSASLVIEHIASDHSGNYTCIASNVAGMERFTVPLTVNVPPKWILEPKDSSAQSGTDVLLHCQSAGYPKPTITWKKAIGPTPGEYKDFLYEPSVQLFPNGTIYFKKISKESQGHFLCEAKNNIGSGVSKVIFLKVNGESPSHIHSVINATPTPYSTRPFSNENETNLCGKGQTGARAMQRAGRQSN